jgi:hypothetical protein
MAFIVDREPLSYAVGSVYFSENLKCFHKHLEAVTTPVPESLNNSLKALIFMSKFTQYSFDNTAAKPSQKAVEGFQDQVCRFEV